MKRLIVLILLIPLVSAKGYMAYPPPFEKGADLSERISFPHIYPGQSFVSVERFLEDPLRPGTSIVRWTDKSVYSINMDKIHLMRSSYTLIIRSKKGPDIRFLPFETTKLYLEPDYYKIRYDRETYTVWLARNSERSN